jgi:hypothetical protein
MKFGKMIFSITPVLDEIENFARLGFDFEDAVQKPSVHHFPGVFSRWTIILPR